VQKDSVSTWAIFMSASLVGGVITSIVVGRQLLRLPVLRNLVLIPSMSSQLAGGSSRFTAQAVTPTGTTQVEVGQEGTAFGDLRPSGIARIGGQKIDVVAQGQYVEKGAPIVIVEVAGNRCVVREVNQS
jgi:membrane-bound ClpP family serine protease